MDFLYINPSQDADPGETDLLLAPGPSRWPHIAPAHAISGRRLGDGEENNPHYNCIEKVK